MEEASVRTLTRYWNGRKYKRLQTSSFPSNRSKLPVATLGGGSNPRRRSWKVRIMPKLRWKMRFSSPMKLLTKVKNTYITMMLNLSGNVGSLNNGNAFGSKRIPKARKVTTVYSSEGVEQRLVYEIYMALKGSRDFAAPMAIV